MKILQRNQLRERIEEQHNHIIELKAEIQKRNKVIRDLRDELDNININIIKDTILNK